MTSPAPETIEREKDKLLLNNLIPRKRLAEMLGKSEVTLIRWEKDGKGPPVTRIGRDVVYSISSVEKWLKAQECGHCVGTLDDARMKTNVKRM